MGHHKKLIIGDKIRMQISCSKEAFEIIETEAHKCNIDRIKMLDAMTKFYVRNFIIVEQLSLTSKQ